MREITKQINEGLEKLRQEGPLIHHLTNHVVMNDCANITLHIGGAPVMTFAPQETEEMASLASGVVLNIGTLTEEYVEEMITAGKVARQKGVPVLLDPVGAGATSMRTSAAKRILDEVGVDIIKGNAGEISVLAGIDATVRGVDSMGTSMEPSSVVQKMAADYKIVAVITGETDWVSNGEDTYKVKNGHKYLSALVGTGCMLDSITTAFASAMEDRSMASVAALAVFGISAELAALNPEVKGPASFKKSLFDEIYNINGDKIEKRAKIEKLHQ